MTRLNRAAAALALAGLALPTAVALGSSTTANAAKPATKDVSFTRIDVDTAISGASFTSVGKVFGRERDIVASGYGALIYPAGWPAGAGSLQLYRPGKTLSDWTKVQVFGPEAGLVFPNATTIADVDKDGDNDIIVPSGYFFGTDPTVPEEQRINSGAITWWENRGAAKPFARHNVITGRPGAYHGVQLVDLDGDKIKDLISVSEEAKTAGLQTDDVIRTQFFKGRADHTFKAPVTLSDVGGSQPVVADVDGDGDLDIASSRYFDPLRGNISGDYPAPTFLWLENTTKDRKLTARDFKVRTIATLKDVGMGFAIEPVVGFRKPGKVSWIGTNHVNRCTFGVLLPAFTWPEQVFEFKPGANIRQPWKRTTLSAAPAGTTIEPCPSNYLAKNPDGTYVNAFTTIPGAITSRPGPGQGAPGVFGAGDIDGDGDLDLAVSGDGDRRLWWIEQEADGSTTLHQLTGEGEYFGQAGGAKVVDLDGDGTQELVFSSFDADTLAIWTPETN